MDPIETKTQENSQPPSTSSEKEPEKDLAQDNESPIRHLVSPIALANTRVRFGNETARVLDLSFLRVVVELDSPWPEFAENEVLSIDFQLDRHSFPATVVSAARGRGNPSYPEWIRFGFVKLLPSAQAHLRSFLSPKKIGESLLEDGRTDEIRHYHGLNESELWFDRSGAVLFTYLDSLDHSRQFLIRLTDSSANLVVGMVRREDYLNMGRLDAELPVAALSDRETYVKLGECRDVVTNFRPTGQIEYNLKQRLLKVISDNLYSTSHRVNMLPQRPKPVTTASVDTNV